MKKFAVIFLSVILVVLSACGNNSAVPENSAPAQANEKVNFEKFGAEDADFVILVNPTNEQKKSVNVTKTVSVSDGEDVVYVMPSKKNSSVEICTAKFDVTTVNIQRDELLGTETLGENECLALTLTIPEGIPANVLTLKTADGKSVNHVISYDGKGDTNVHFR